jgi:transcription elongation factor GreA
MLDARRTAAPAKGVRAAVSLGSHVVLEDVDDGSVETYELVEQAESNVAAGRLSAESPVGKAIAGHRRGDVVDVHAPHAIRHLLIVDVDG